MSYSWWFHSGQGRGAWVLQQVVNSWSPSLVGIQCSGWWFLLPHPRMYLGYFLMCLQIHAFSLSLLVCSNMCIQIYYVWCLFCISHTVSLFHPPQPAFCTSTSTFLCLTVGKLFVVEVFSAESVPHLLSTPACTPVLHPTSPLVAVSPVVIQACILLHYISTMEL